MGMKRWTCTTCKGEFESLMEQRSYFKSDFHRLNIKLSVACKGTIKEEDFDETTLLNDSIPIENPSPNFPHGTGMSVPVSGSSTAGDTVKKKRGRPRKYVPEGGNVSLALSPMSPTPSPGSGTPAGGTKKKGRPPGSGWRQHLAPLGYCSNDIFIFSAEAKGFVHFVSQRFRFCCNHAPVYPFRRHRNI